MKFKLIVIGMVAGLILPVVGANAEAVFDPGVNQAGAGADLQRGAAHPAENFGRREDEGKGDKDRKCDDGDHGDHDDDCDKSPSKPHYGSKKITSNGVRSRTYAVFLWGIASDGATGSRRSLPVSCLLGAFVVDASAVR